MVWKTGKTMMPRNWKKEYKMSMNILGDKMMSLVKGIVGYFALAYPNRDGGSNQFMHSGHEINLDELKSCFCHC